MPKMTTTLTLAPAALILLLSAQPAIAYVGPGSGLGAVGMVLGLIGTLFLSMLSFIWYPIKRLYRKVRRPAPVPQRARVTWRGNQQP